MSLENPVKPEPIRPTSLQRHPTDAVALIFGILFLAATALALLFQVGSLEDAAARSWAAGVILVIAGAAAVVGTLVGARRRAHPAAAASPPHSELD